MTTYHWASATSGSWTTAGDWTPDGGPRVESDSALGPYSDDDAVFATGSCQPYTVTVGGLSASIAVIGDHVTFDNFYNSQQGEGGGLFVEAGGLVVVSKTSDLNYGFRDNGGGPIKVTGATVVSHGDLACGYVDLRAGGLLVESGSTASLDAGEGAEIGSGGTMRVLDGASFRDDLGTSNIDGLLVVGGQGSHAELGVQNCSGEMLVTDHATASVFDEAELMRFAVGDGATLHLYTYEVPSFESGEVAFVGPNATLVLGGPLSGPITGFEQSDAFIAAGRSLTPFGRREAAETDASRCITGLTR